MPLLRPKAVIFDCDGTLLDSEQCWLDMLNTLAVELRLPQNALEGMRGVTAGFAARQLTRYSDLTEEAALALINTRYSQSLSSVTCPLPGVRTLLDSLHGRIPLAVATNGRSEDVSKMLYQAGIEHYFDTLATVEDVKHGKPNPEIYRYACRRLNVAPSDAVVFEDSIVGARAASDAGCTIVGLRLPPVSFPLINADSLFDVSYAPRTGSLAIHSPG